MTAQGGLVLTGWTFIRDAIIDKDGTDWWDKMFIDKEFFLSMKMFYLFKWLRVNGVQMAKSGKIWLKDAQ